MQWNWKLDKLVGNVVFENLPSFNLLSLAVLLQKYSFNFFIDFEGASKSSQKVKCKHLVQNSLKSMCSFVHHMHFLWTLENISMYDNHLACFVIAKTMKLPIVYYWVFFEKLAFISLLVPRGAGGQLLCPSFWKKERNFPDSWLLCCGSMVAWTPYIISKVTQLYHFP